MDREGAELAGEPVGVHAVAFALVAPGAVFHLVEALDDGGTGEAVGTFGGEQVPKVAQEHDTLALGFDVVIGGE